MLAITFPRDAPAALRVAKIKFLLVDRDELAPSLGGEQFGKDLGPKLWMMDIRTGFLKPEWFGEVRAFRDTLASTRQFYGYDKSAEYPVMYRETKWAGLTVDASPFDGTCTLGGVTDNKLIDLEDLPVGFKLRPGDYLAFDYLSANRALHRVSAGGDADGSGNLTVEVRPFVRTGWVEDATVQLYRPSTRMVIVPNSYDEDIIRTGHGQITFKAAQSITAE